MSASTTSDLGTMPASRWRALNALCTAHQQTKPWVPLADVLKLDDLEALVDLENRRLIEARLGSVPMVLAETKLSAPLVRTMQVRITSAGVGFALDTHSNLVIRVLGPHGNAGRQIRHVLHEASVGFEVPVAMNNAGLLAVADQADVPLESLRGVDHLLVRLTAAGRKYWPRGA